MALNTVTLKWDITDLAQAGLPAAGAATLSITPTAQMADATDHILIPATPRLVPFSGGTGQLAGIVANDNSAILPAGTGYLISVVAANGQVLVPQFQTQLNFAAGATQWLDQLAPAAFVTTAYQYDPLGAAAAALAAAEAACLLLAGGTMAGPVAMGNHKITGLANGSGAQDAAAFGQIPVLDSTASDIAPSGATSAAGSTGKSGDAGHVHGVGLYDETWMPNDTGIGFLAWTGDPNSISVGSAPANNTVTLTRINIRQQITVTNVVVALSAVGSGLVSNENFVGLYNSSGTLIGTSADQTAAWGSTGMKVAALTGGPFVCPAGFYWVAILPNESAGTVPSFGRSPAVLTAITNMGVSAANSRAATAGTGTSLPTPITPASNTQINNAYWAALS